MEAFCWGAGEERQPLGKPSLVLEDNVKRFLTICDLK
jgi:hypothetical protein